MQQAHIAAMTNDQIEALVIVIIIGVAFIRAFHKNKKSEDPTEDIYK